MLNNAVKYTDTGSVTLSVSGEIQDSNVNLCFEVEDTGIGIKEEDIQKLFEEFTRIEEGRNRNIEGIGLGIDISVQLLNLMGSKLMVESTYGKGSKFYFTLAQEIADKEPIGNLEERIRRQATEYSYCANFTASKAKVLVVDDDAINRRVFVNLLKETRVHVDEASGGEECLELIQERKYHIIFLDHMMPEMDGIEAMKNIRLKGNWCEEVPVVALTANTTDEARQLFKMEGMQDFLAKPIELSLLHDILLKWIPKEKIVFSDISEGYIINEELTCDSGNTAFTKSRLLKEGIYLEIGLPYFGGNIKAYKATMESILKDCKKKVVLLENHFLAGDLKNYAIEAHSVKSVSASIGATAFSDLAKDNELKAKADDRDYIEANGSYFITKYKEFLNSIEQILAEEKQHEAQKQLETANEKLKENLNLTTLLNTNLSCVQIKIIALFYK